MTYRRKKIAIIIIATEIKEYVEKKSKKDQPAWPSSQSQFAGMPATAGDLAPIGILSELITYKNMAKFQLIIIYLYWSKINHTHKKNQHNLRRKKINA